MSKTFINLAYEPAKDLRDKIHCFDVMLMFANYAHGTYLHD